MSKMHELCQRLPVEMSGWMLHECGDLTNAWRNCPRADWLVVLALRLGIGRATVVRATSGLVSAAVAERRAPDLRINRAVVTTLGWLTGRALAKEAWAAGFCAMDAAKALREPLDIATARAAACLAFACDEQADDVFYAHRAYAASAAREASGVIGGPAAGADRIREEIPLSMVLGAFEAMPEALVRVPNTDTFDISANPTRP